MKYADRQQEVLTAVKSIRGGSLVEIHECVSRKTIEPVDPKTVERHLMQLCRLGNISPDAELRDGKPIKTWKVMSCPERTPDGVGCA